MLIRIVRMTFHPDAVDAFMDHFDRAAPLIRSFPGCEHLELWRDLHAPYCCTTYSHWADQDALDAYRQSDLFRETWTEVKPLFAARPEARSYARVRSASTIEQRADAN